MKEQTRRNVLALCDASKRMRDAVNNLWWAHNPDELDGDAPSVEDAQDEQSDAFHALKNAEYYARKSLDQELIK